MDAQLLLDNFATIADAPGGVPRLRELILDLAVRGQLVPRNPADEPASVLLERIAEKRSAAQHARSVGRSRAQHAVPVSIGHVALPDGWVWANIGDASVNRDSERIPLKREDRAARKGRFDYYGASGVIDHIDDYLFDGTYLLVGEDGANLRLRSTPIAFLASGRFWVNNHAHVLDSVSTTALRYLAVFLNSIDLVPYLTGTAQPKLNQARMNRIPIPLPPLEEQERIVAKVDELMERCNECETRQERRARIRTGLRTSALEALTTAGSPDDLRSAWGRLTDNWPAITPDVDSVADLRRTILQLAVQGRLTEPAQRAEGEATNNYAAQKLHREKLWDLPGIETAPRSWARLPLAGIGTWGSGGTPAKSHAEYHGGSIPWLVIGDLNDGPVTNADSSITEAGLANSSAKWVEPGSVLIAMYGASIGKTGVTMIRCTTNQAIAHCTPDTRVIGTDYLFLLARAFKQALEDMGRGAAQPNISQQVLKHLVVPVPPLAEQGRIVSRVNELMTLCDDLDAGLRRESALRDSAASGVTAQLTAVAT